MDPQHHVETSGPLAGHVREGRRFSSRLAATGAVRIEDWARDDLPDLVWPLLTLSQFGTAYARNFVCCKKQFNATSKRCSSQNSSPKSSMVASQAWIGWSKELPILDRLSHNDDILDHRVVDTSDSFAGGKSLRSMAEECGLLDLYRHAYYMASGVAHSEWWSVETHCMEQCLNILHRGHMIPSLSLSAGGNVELASSWVDALCALIRASLDILGADQEAVTQAFTWLSVEDHGMSDSKAEPGSEACS